MTDHAVTKDQIAYLVEASRLALHELHRRTNPSYEPREDIEAEILGIRDPEGLGRVLWRTYVTAHLKTRVHYLLGKGPQVLDQLGHQDGEYQHQWAPDNWLPNPAELYRSAEHYEQTCRDAETDDVWDPTEAGAFIKRVRGIARQLWLSGDPGYRLPAQGLSLVKQAAERLQREETIAEARANAEVMQRYNQFKEKAKQPYASLT